MHISHQKEKRKKRVCARDFDIHSYLFESPYVILTGDTHSRFYFFFCVYTFIEKKKVEIDNNRKSLKNEN